jgi:hypothetical protein
LFARRLQRFINYEGDSWAATMVPPDLMEAQLKALTKRVPTAPEPVVPYRKRYTNLAARQNALRIHGLTEAGAGVGAGASASASVASGAGATPGASAGAGSNRALFRPDASGLSGMMTITRPAAHENPARALLAWHQLVAAIAHEFQHAADLFGGKISLEPEKSGLDYIKSEFRAWAAEAAAGLVLAIGATRESKTDDLWMVIHHLEPGREISAEIRELALDFELMATRDPLVALADAHSMQRVLGRVAGYLGIYKIAIPGVQGTPDNKQALKWLKDSEDAKPALSEAVEIFRAGRPTLTTPGLAPASSSPAPAPASASASAAPPAPPSRGEEGKDEWPGMLGLS